DAKTEVIENNLLLKILHDALEKMSQEELKELAKELDINDLNYSAEALLGVFQAIFCAGGFKSYQLTLIIANAISRALFGKGLTLAANATL
ncbi:ubiquinol-cytochrome C chaperone family protein, partial [Staphylococcus aureus]|nr:ubiquinol-cytochrome C chaperone family protein [Staphylococcus aureus]